ncbi:protein-tyrosine-phosphatase [Entamoeba marina]
MQITTPSFNSPTCASPRMMEFLSRSFDSYNDSSDSEYLSPFVASPEPQRFCFSSSKQRLSMSEISTEQSELYPLTLKSDLALPCNHQLYGVSTINCETFKKAIKDKMELVIIDCRYPYEYEAGHLDGSINIWNEIDLLRKFPVKNRSTHSKDILVFYCEFSRTRGPALARKLRQFDMKIANDILNYNDIYVIEGGYEVISESLKEWCIGSYVKMDDLDHKNSKKKYVKLCCDCRKQRTSRCLTSSSVTTFDYSF